MVFAFNSEAFFWLLNLGLCFALLGFGGYLSPLFSVYDVGSSSLSLSPMHCVPSQGLLGRHIFQLHPCYTSCDHFSLRMHYIFSNLGFIVTELSPFMQYKCFIFLCRQLIPFVSLLLLFKSFNLSQGYL